MVKAILSCLFLIILITPIAGAFEYYELQENYLAFGGVSAVLVGVCFMASKGK